MVLYVLLVLLAVAEAAGACVVMWLRVGRKASEVRKNVEILEEERKRREDFFARIQTACENMIDIDLIREKVQEIRLQREALKAERGRITITHAELETVESRLRELEEIERELEASAVETREEINILTKKREELQEKNTALRAQLAESFEKISAVMSQIEMSAQLQQRIDRMKDDLVRTQEQIDVLLGKMQEGNDQYFQMKQRYDALDIEYAQLYEKFSASKVVQEE